jgi:pilus assembly protein Flp/PilA
MDRIVEMIWKARIWKDTRGQDMIEYALMAGFVALAAAAAMPSISSQISTIFDKIKSSLTSAAGAGS